MGQNWRPTTNPGEYNIFFLAYQRKLNGSKSFFQYVQTAHYIGQALNTTTITKSQYLYFLFLYKKKYLYFWCVEENSTHIYHIHMYED